MPTYKKQDTLECAQDETLALFARGGNSDAACVLIRRYSSVVRSCIRAGEYPGMELDDLIQEGMIGLIAAIRTFDLEHNTSFRTYARICISSKISAALSSCLRKKHLPLNSYVALSSLGGCEAGIYGASLSGALYDPVASAIDNENMVYMQKQMDSQLSRLEQDAFALYLKGYSYSEIARELSSSSKSVGNALQRVRRKLRTAWIVHADG